VDHRQGQSPFVWSALGGIAAVTDRMTIGTAVTCPTVRMHPALIAQAAATIACMLPGRFFLGVGTGERLNEHIFGDPWPSVSTRRAMPREAVEILRRLWTGELITYEGEYFSIDGAKI
jgi:coenzyme F420-dependent glucose-6-phosphate dehydrogenase